MRVFTMLGDELAAALPELRAQAESLMTTVGTVTRADGVTTDIGGREIPIHATVYTGRAKVSKTSSAIPESVSATGADTAIQQVTMSFPVGSFRMRIGDVFTVSSNCPDPGMVGRVYRLVAESPSQTWAVAYRVQAEELLR